MNQIQSEKLLKNIPDYQDNALNFSRTIHQKILDGGQPTRTLADFFHGSWLGHPLHAVLTDVVLGAWFMSAVLDVVGMLRRNKGVAEAADTLVGLGIASAVPTAIAGVTDFTTMPRRAVASGATHGLLNGLVLGLFSLSYACRKSGNRGLGVFFSGLGLGLGSVSAWLGGEMSFKYAIGVNKTQAPSGPQEWAVVVPDASLAEGEPQRVEVQGQPVMLYRKEGTIYAIGAVCPHEGGPLEEGKFDGQCVECPWHQSVFDLRDGSVVHGPSTYSVASYQARVKDGNIELRLDGE